MLKLSFSFTLCTAYLISLVFGITFQARAQPDVTYNDISKVVDWRPELRLLPTGNYYNIRTNVHIFAPYHAETALTEFDSVVHVITLYNPNKQPIDSFLIKADAQYIPTAGASGILDTANARIVQCLPLKNYLSDNFTFVGYRLLIFNYNLEVINDAILERPPVENDPHYAPLINVRADDYFLTIERKRISENPVNYLYTLHKIDFENHVLASNSDAFIRHTGFSRFFHEIDNFFYVIGEEGKLYKLSEASLIAMDSLITDTDFQINTRYNNEIYAAGLTYSAISSNPLLPDTFAMHLYKLNTEIMELIPLYHYSYFDWVDNSANYYPPLNSGNYRALAIYDSTQFYNVIICSIEGTAIQDYYILHSGSLNGSTYWTYKIDITDTNIYPSYHRTVALPDGGVMLYLYLYKYNDGQLVHTSYEYIRFSRDGVPMDYSPTAAQWLTKNNTVSLFPNPATSQVQMQFGEAVPQARVRVYTLEGKQVGGEQVVSNAVHTIEVAHLPKGMYWVQVYTDVGLYATQKLVVQ